MDSLCNPPYRILYQTGIKLQKERIPVLYRRRGGAGSERVQCMNRKALFFMVIFFSTAAYAHVYILKYEPAPDAVLTDPPKEVVLSMAKFTSVLCTFCFKLRAMS
jgi:hypothetical protein